MKNEEVDFASVEVLPRLPDWFHPNQGDPLPCDIVGATIINFGTIPTARSVEGGGLIIDYQSPGSDQPTRIVLAFNELGMWVESQLPLPRNSMPV